MVWWEPGIFLLNRLNLIKLKKAFIMPGTKKIFFGNSYNHVEKIYKFFFYKIHNRTRRPVAGALVSPQLFWSY